MESLDRRAFLVRSGAVVAAAGAAVLVPTQLAGAAARVTGPTPHPEDLTLGSEEIPASEPFIVHVRDASSGEIAIYSGNEEITFTDRNLVSRLARAAGGR